MNERKSGDHWNILAVELGAVPAMELGEEPETPELSTPIEMLRDERPVEQAPTPEPPLEIEASFESAQVEVSAPPRKIPKPVSRQAIVPKPKQVNHWRELATALGIEVTEPEPEPEPEPTPIQEVVQEQIRQADAVEDDLRGVTPPPEVLAWPPMRTEQSIDDEVSARAESRREHRRSSLFEDPNLSLDTPGVLDAIFDEVEAESVAVPEPAANRGRTEARAYERPRDERPRDERPRDERPRDERPRDERPRDERPRDERPRDERLRDERSRDERSRDERSRDERPRDERSRDERSRDERSRDERSRDEPFVPKERVFGSYDGLAALDEAPFDRVESDAAGDLDEPNADGSDVTKQETLGEEDKSGRRRGRRRRRGGRRAPRPASEPMPNEAGIEDLEDEEEGDEMVPELVSGAAPVRDRHVRVEAEQEDDLEDDADEQFDDEDEEEDGGERLRLKHKKIPTWQQAIDAILATNMESRAKNPGGGGGRGRGRRWRR